MSLRLPQIPEYRLLGGRIHAIDIDAFFGLVEQAIRARTRLILAHQNLHGLAVMRRCPSMRTMHELADYVYIDGTPIVWYGRLLGCDLGPRHRITSLDWIVPLLERCAREGWRVFILSSEQHIIEAGASNIQERIPGIQLGWHHGFVGEPGEPGASAAAALVRDFRADILLVGMGMPRQERWIRHHAEAAGAHVTIPVGAMIDYIAGKIPTPPRWLGTCGLEWLYRLATEPRRLGTRYLWEPLTLLPAVWEDLRRPAAKGMMNREDGSSPRH